jgi:ABC-type transport system involved in multi-copper enzyme maturation permease subunit
MFQYLKKLCDGTDISAQAHIAAFLFVIVVLALTVLGLSIAAIFVSKPAIIATIIGMILPHIACLVGYNIAKNCSNQPPDQDQHLDNQPKG